MTKQLTEARLRSMVEFLLVQLNLMDHMQNSKGIQSIEKELGLDPLDPETRRKYEKWR